MHNARAESVILETLDHYSTAYARHDLADILSLFAPDPNIVLFGTGADEKRIGIDEVRRQFERNFQETEASTITWGWRHVSVADNMAWVAADAVINVRMAGQDMQFPIRMTIVLQQRDGMWQWVHRHASASAIHQAAGKSYPMAERASAQ